MCAHFPLHVHLYVASESPPPFQNEVNFYTGVACKRLQDCNHWVAVHAWDFNFALLHQSIKGVGTLNSWKVCRILCIFCGPRCFLCLLKKCSLSQLAIQGRDAKKRIMQMSYSSNQNLFLSSRSSLRWAQTSPRIAACCSPTWVALP